MTRHERQENARDQMCERPAGRKVPPRSAPVHLLVAAVYLRAGREVSGLISARWFRAPAARSEFSSAYWLRWQTRDDSLLRHRQCGHFATSKGKARPGGCQSRQYLLAAALTCHLLEVRFPLVRGGNCKDRSVDERQHHGAHTGNQNCSGRAFTKGGQPVANE